MIDSATIAVGGKDYTLEFPLSGMLEAERKIGKPLQFFFNVKEGDIPDYTIAQLLILFRIGMKKHQPTLTEEQIDEIFLAFIREGDSSVGQTAVIYLLLGKALGFFRVDMNIQEEAKKALGKAKK